MRHHGLAFRYFLEGIKERLGTLLEGRECV